MHLAPVGTPIVEKVVLQNRKKEPLFFKFQRAETDEETNWKYEIWFEPPEGFVKPVSFCSILKQIQ